MAKTSSKSKHQNSRTLPQIAKAIKALEKKSIANVIAIGKLLHEAKEQCDHGEYLPWLKDNFGWSEDTATRYRGIYKFSQIPQFAEFAKLDISISALYLAARCLIDNLDKIDQAAGKAILAAAKRGRVSYKMAYAIFEEHRKAASEEEASTDESSTDESSTDESSTDESSDGESSDGTLSPELSKDQEAILSELYHIDTALQCHPDVVWAKLIETMGSEKFSGIGYGILNKHEQYHKGKDVKVRADRAANRGKAAARGQIGAAK